MAESFVLPGFNDATQNCAFWQIAKSIIHIELTIIQGQNASNPAPAEIAQFSYGILHIIHFGKGSTGAPIACAPSNLDAWFQLPYYEYTGAVINSNVYAQVSNGQINMYSGTTNYLGIVDGFLYIIE